MAGGPESAAKDTEELFALRDALPVGGGTITLEAGRTYTYDDERWLLFGDRPVVIEGNGATLEAINLFRHSPIYPLGAGPLVWDPPYPVPATDNTAITPDVGRRIQTVEAGSVTLQLVEPAPGYCQPGDTILIAGYIQQVDPNDPDKPWGWPPNFRYFEYRTVDSARSDTITLTEPLRFAYDASWKEYPQDFFGIPSFVGAARVWRWRHDDGRRPNRSLTWRNLTLRGNSLGMSSLHTRFEDCTLIPTGGTIWPGIGQSAEFARCTLNGMEPDKLVERVLLEDCVVTGRLGGTGAGFLLFDARRCIFQGFVQLVGRDVRFDGCRFDDGVHLSVNGALSNGDQPPFTMTAEAIYG